MAMAKSTNPRNPTKKTCKISYLQNQNKEAAQKPPPPSWTLMMSILTCRNLDIQSHRQQQQPQQQQQQTNSTQQQTQKQKRKNQKQHNTKPLHKHDPYPIEELIKKSRKMRCSGSLCNTTKVMHHRSATTSPEVQHKKRAASLSINDTPLREVNGNNNGVVSVNSLFSVSSSSSSSSSSLVSVSSSSNASASFINGAGGSIGGSESFIRGMPFRRFSGCYECRMVVDPVLGFARDPSFRSSICTCHQCGEIMKPENLELHQAVRHAVSELGPEDTSKNIVEIIFQSSWLKKQTPVCKIDRILKVHNTQKTISKFEEYRDFIKAKATKLPRKHPRCLADGNELLRFHCTTFMCSLGLNGSSNLCNSFPQCNICSIIKNGFKLPGPRINGGAVAVKGILTTATSGKAHDRAEIGNGDHHQEKRAMLVCRVIAGRVKKSFEGSGIEEYDSVAGAGGGGGGVVYSNLDELYVFNPKAILPCFVVIYGGF